MQSAVPHDGAKNLALFIDVENLIAAASSMGLPINMAPVISRLKENGRVLVRRCYGDLKKCLIESGRGSQLDSVRRMLHENLIQIEDIPFVTSHKNAADLQLVVEALSLAFTNSGISTFVIVSSDRDYVPLYNKLHELGKTVITVPIDRENVHRMILEAADQVLYYDSFFDSMRANPTTDRVTVPSAMPQAAAPQPSTASPNGGVIGTPTVVPPGLYGEYVRALQQAIRAIVDEGTMPLGAMLRPRLVQIRSDFEPTLVDCRNLKAFVQRAEKDHFVKVDWKDGAQDYVVSMGEKSLLVPLSTAAPSADRQASDARIERAATKFLEDKLGLPLPKFVQRDVILRAADAAFTTRMQMGVFTLSEWKEFTIQQLKAEHEMVDERAVFKLLLSVHYARCLYWEPSENRHNPIITGRRLPMPDWDHWIVANWVKQTLKEGGYPTLGTDCYARIFFTGADDGIERMERIMAIVESN